MEITNDDDKGICHRHTQNSLIWMITYFEERMWFIKSAENTDIRSIQFILVHLNWLISRAKNFSFRAHKRASPLFMDHLKLHSKHLLGISFNQRNLWCTYFGIILTNRTARKGCGMEEKINEKRYKICTINSEQVTKMVDFGTRMWYLHSMIAKYTFLLPLSESFRWTTHYTTNTIYLNSCGEEVKLDPENMFFKKS
jgi:hypothetical protein